MKEMIFKIAGELTAVICDYRIHIISFLTGAFMIVLGCYISIYKNIPFRISKHAVSLKREKYLTLVETFTNKPPFRILSQRLDRSISYFMLGEGLQRKIVVVSTLLLPAMGLGMYFSLNTVIVLWYTKLITLLLCLMVPYYIFTLAVDYMKYSLRLKVPVLIDSFRSSFMSHYRIKPALYECSKNIDKSLGRIISRVSDSSDLNASLCAVRDRLNDTWFNVFVLLLINYRENGGELIAQLYKLNRTITRYNNVEKKKNKRLIWYEVFTVTASIFSLPVILLINRMILGVNVSLYYNVTSSFAKLVVFSLMALVLVRILRRM